MTGIEVAIAVAAVAAAASAGTAIYQGQQQAEAQNFNAKVAKNQALWAQATSKADADKQRRRDARLMSAQRARLAASGLDATTGSPLEIMAETAASANADYRAILLGGQRRADQYNSAASLNQFYASNAETAGYLNAANAVLGGGAQAASVGAAGGFFSSQEAAYTGGSYSGNFSQAGGSRPVGNNGMAGGGV